MIIHDDFHLDLHLWQTPELRLLLFLREVSIGSGTGVDLLAIH